MLNLWSNIFNGVTFEEDKDYLRQLRKIASTEIGETVPHSGHRYAMRRAASTLTNAAHLRELCSGLSFVEFMKKSAENADVDEVIDNLKKIGKLVFQKDTMRCALNGEASRIRSSLNSYEEFLKSLPRAEKCSKEGSSLNVSNAPPFSNPNTNQEHFVLPFNCNYIGRAQVCVPFTHEAYPKLNIVAKLLSAKFLHQEIREKGGAYGGGATLGKSGIFSFFSYRDPKVVSTLNSFEAGLKWILNDDNYTNQDLNEAKLSAFQEVDKPIAAGNQGIRNFLEQIDDKMLSEFRLRLLNVTREDMKEVVNGFLANGSQTNCTGVALLGPECEEISRDQDKWKKIQPAI